MRIANLSGRLVIVTGDPDHEVAHDVDKASSGRFGPDPQAVFDEWDAFTAWAGEQAWTDGARFERDELRSPVPAPRQAVGIGLNYGDHVAESGFDVPDVEPVVFTKFASCITGPYSDVVLPAGGHTDWEVELVVVIGRRAYRVDAADALSYVAGYSVGQDISERVLQLAASPPQFSLGKSLPGFGPIGPWLVTPDDIADPADLELGCAVNGEQVQLGRTRDMIFSVPYLIDKLSASMTLLPGDVIFTGTPSGVGMGRSPQRWLNDGDILTSHIEGIGQLRHRFVAASSA